MAYRRFRGRYPTYRRSVRAGVRYRPRYRGYGGHKGGYKGGLSTVRATRTLNTRRQKGARMQVQYRRRKVGLYSQKPSLPRSVAMLVKNGVAPSGTYVNSGASCTERITWNTGEQGVNQVDNTIMSFEDLGAAFFTAMADVSGATNVATPVIEPNFWIKSAVLKLRCSNHSQADCWVTAYPCITRYDNSDTTNDAINQNLTTSLEIQGFATGTNEGPAVLGYTPFMNRAFCERYKILRPKKVLLQGGQSYTFTLKMTKPFHHNYGRSSGTNTLMQFAHVSRAIVLACQGTLVSEDLTPTEVSYASGALDTAWTKTYEWVAAPMPHHYMDIIENFPAITTPTIIQPQTGAVNNLIATT